MRLLLVRHGDPDYARDALTPLGQQQVQRLGEAFRQVLVDELCVSPMGRAQLTAAPIVAATRCPPITLPWLHELNGNYAGQLWAWNQHGVEAFAGDEPLGPHNWHEQVPYGAHMIRVAGEFYACFDQFMAQRGYHRHGARYRLEQPQAARQVLFVCHGGVIATLLSHLLHIPLPVTYSQMAIAPSSRTTLVMEVQGGYGVFRLTGLNDLSHLPEGFTSPGV